MKRPPHPPTVSVVIPAYNAAGYVGRAVASALSQTLPPEQVVCVDDGSTDDTLERLHTLAERFPEKVRVVQQTNAGPSAARNRGLERVTSEYVQFLDADDELDPDKLERQTGLAGASPRPADLVVSAYRMYDTDPTKTRLTPIADDEWVGLLTSRLGITSSNLCRTESVRRVGGWNEDRATSEDPDLWFRLMQSGAVVVMDAEPRVTLWRRPESQWNSDLRRSLEGWVRLRGEVWAYLEEHGLNTDERRRKVEESAYKCLESLAKRIGDRDALTLVKRAGVPFFPHHRRFLHRLAFQAGGFWTVRMLKFLKTWILKGGPRPAVPASAHQVTLGGNGVSRPGGRR